MLTKTILGEAIGVQHGGIQDRTSSNTVQGITHGLIIGKFKRGRTDQPMRISKDTIKARLGYEPNNPFYQVVQDCVDKFPSVWVLRVGASNGGGGVVVPPVGQISCDGATNTVTAMMDEPSGISTILPTHLEIDVNGITGQFTLDQEGNLENQTLFEQTFPDLEFLPTGFANKSLANNLRLKARWLPLNQDTITNFRFIDNPTAAVIDGWAAACLAPKQEVITDDCSSTAITFEIFQSWNGMNESGYEKSIKLYDATTNELLGIGEAPIEADDGDYSNILPDFIDNLNGGNHQVTATHRTDEYSFLRGFKLVSATHRKFRLEVFIGNEGGVSVLPMPETNMDDVSRINHNDSESGAEIVNFCLQPYHGCEPIGLDIPVINLPSGTYTINVSRDGFGTESNSMQFSGNIRTSHFFTNILAPFIASDENPFAYFTDSYDGISHFQIQNWMHRIEGAGEMDVEMRDPCTLTLSGSAIEAIYGQGSVEIHSCGRMGWMGV